MNPSANHYPPSAYAYPRPPPDHLRRLLTFAVRGFIAFCIAFGAAILVLWLIYRPQKMQIAVSSAAFRRFNLSSPPAGNPILAFDLSADLTIRNPNNRAGIYYDWLEARTDFDGLRFGLAGLPGFYQGPKEATALPARFEGEEAVPGGDVYAVAFAREKAAGFFSVDLWVYGRVRYRFGAALTRRYVLRALCQLRIPAGRAPFSFTDCDVLDL